MARLLRSAKRVGTTPMRFQFDLTIHTVRISLPESMHPANLLVNWTRGPKRVETKHEVTLPPFGGASWNETISMMVTLYKDNKKNTFQEKSAKVSVTQVTKKGQKVLGTVSMNLGDFAQLDGSQRKSFFLEKCIDPSATIEMTVKSTWMKNANLADDQVSQFTDMSAVSLEDNDAHEAQGEHKNSDQDLTGLGFTDHHVDTAPVAAVPAPVSMHSLLPTASPAPAIPLTAANAAAYLSPGHSPDRVSPVPEGAGSGRVPRDAKRGSFVSQINYLEDQLSQSQEEFKLRQQQLEERTTVAEAEKRKFERKCADLQIRLDALSREKEQQQRESVDKTARLEKTIAELTGSTEGIKAQLKDLEEQIVHSQSEKEKAVLSVKLEAQKEAATNTQLRNKMNDLLDQIKKLQKEKEETESLLEQYRDKADQRRSSILESSMEDATFAAYRDETEHQIADLKRQVQDLKAQNQQQQEAFESTRKELDDLRHDPKHSGKELAIDKALLEQEVAEVHNRLQLSKNTEEELRRDLKREKEKAHHEIQDAKDRAEALTAENEGLKGHIRALEEQVHNLETEKVSRSNFSTVEIERIKTTAEREKDEMTRELKSVKEMLREHQNLLADADQINRRLERDLKEVRDKMASGTSDAAVILSSQLQAVEQELSSIKTQRNHELAALHEENLVLQKEVQVLQDQLDRAQDEADSSIAELEVQKDILQRELADLKLRGTPGTNHEQEYQLHAAPMKSVAVGSPLPATTSLNNNNNSNNGAVSAVEMEILKSQNITLRAEIDAVRQLARKNDEELRTLEKQLIGAKMGWAQCEMERENAVSKQRDLKALIRRYAAKVSTMEVELENTKDRLASLTAAQQGRKKSTR